MTVFWDVAPCSLVETDDDTVLLTVSITRAIVLMMEAISTSETTVSFYQTTRRNIPDIRVAVRTSSLTYGHYTI
jgi:hypothetical protein